MRGAPRFLSRFAEWPEAHSSTAFSGRHPTVHPALASATVVSAQWSHTSIQRHFHLLPFLFQWCVSNEQRVLITSLRAYPFNAVQSDFLFGCRPLQLRLLQLMMIIFSAY